MRNVEPAGTPSRADFELDTNEIEDLCWKLLVPLDWRSAMIVAKHDEALVESYIERAWMCASDFGKAGRNYGQLNF